MMENNLLIHRFVNILASLIKMCRIDDHVASTTVDDRIEGKRQYFQQSRVNELLVKCGLLEADDIKTDHKKNHQQTGA